MKKTLFTIAAALALLCLAEQPSGSYLTWLGNNAGKDATANQSEFVGALSGQNAHDIYRSSFLGVMSGYNAFGIYNCFAAGIGALANATNVSGSVFIGPYAGRNARDVSGRTDINGQFFSDKGRDEFRIVTDPAKPVPVHYRGGILREQTDFAIRTDDADRAAWERADAHVWLSSFDGDDANSGLSPTGAVKTIAGAYNAAYRAVTNGTLNASNEIVVAVAEGVYAPVDLTSALTNGIAFVATGDRGDTIIDGMLAWARDDLNPTNYPYGKEGARLRCANGVAFNNSHLAFVAPFSLEGFTITRFNYRYGNEGYGDTGRSVFHGITFKRCDITGNVPMPRYGTFSGEFIDCDIHGNKVLPYTYNTAVSAFFGGWANYYREWARLVRCHVWDNDISPCEKLIYEGSLGWAEHCLFEVEFCYGFAKGGHNTYIAETLNNHHVSGLSEASGFSPISTNSFFVVRNLEERYLGVVGVQGSNCIVTNANLTADFVAADASCPSVRSGDLPDYGYRNSGFRHEADPTVPEWAKAESAPTYTAADVGAVSTNGATMTGALVMEAPIVIRGVGSAGVQFGDTVLYVLDGNGLPSRILTYSEIAQASDIPTSMAWGSITGKPTTLSGYGITDALSSGGVSNIVTQALVRDRLGVYLYVGEDGGIYVHTGD